MIPQSMITPSTFCQHEIIYHTYPIWGSHAEKTGGAASQFLSKNCVALGWHSMDDLSKLAPNL